MKMLLLLTLILPALNLSAQEVETLQSINVTEVKGSKDKRKFNQLNESISVLKAKNLNRGDLNNSVQMLDGLSNIQTSKNGENFSIRGISDMGVTGYQKDNLASILVDDIFQTTLSVKAGSFENWDLDSIEVYRGAQSTTQGVNSLAGNILLFHTKPVFTDEAQGKLVFGNFGRKEAGVVLNKAVSEKFAVRLSYNKEMTDGYIKNSTTGNDKWGGKNKDHFVSDFLYKASTKDEFRLNIKLLRMHQGGLYVQGNDFEDYKVTEDQDYKSITNNEQVGLTYNRRLSEAFSNKMIFGFTQASAFTTSDGDGTSNGKGGARKEDDQDQFMSVENQFLYSTDKIKNLFGVHVHRYNLRNFYDFNLLYDLPSPTLVIPVTQENTKTRHTYSLFESFTYDFTNHHSLNLGARFEVVKNESGADIDAANTGVAPVDTYLQSVAGKYDDDKTNKIVLPKVGYTYSNKDYSLGAFFTQGYRTGGLSINRERAKVLTYDPELTNNYELSYKLTRQKFVFTSNLFYTKWNDQQVEVKLPGGPYDSQVENAANSELYGVEVESSYLLPNTDSIRMNLGHVHTQFLSFNNNGTNYTGNSFPDAAKFTGQASYWKSLRDDLRLIMISRYIGNSYSDPENLRKSPEQFYFDANTQYYFGNYMAELYLKNIFNQKYRTYHGFPRTTAPSYQVTYNRVSIPREVGVRLNYYWD